MSDLGRRLRHTLDEVAPPADLDRIVAHEPSLPFWRVGRGFAYAAVLVAVVGVTVVLLTRDGSDDTAVDSSVTTVDETATTVADGEPASTSTTIPSVPLVSAGEWPLPALDPILMMDECEMVEVGDFVFEEFPDLGGLQATSLRATDVQDVMPLPRIGSDSFFGPDPLLDWCFAVRRIEDVTAWELRGPDPNQQLFAAVRPRESNSVPEGVIDDYYHQSHIASGQGFNVSVRPEGRAVGVVDHDYFVMAGPLLVPGAGDTYLWGEDVAMSLYKAPLEDRDPGGIGIGSLFDPTGLPEGFGPCTVRSLIWSQSGEGAEWFDTEYCDGLGNDIVIQHGFGGDYPPPAGAATEPWGNAPFSGATWTAAGRHNILFDVTGQPFVNVWVTASQDVVTLEELSAVTESLLLFSPKLVDPRKGSATFTEAADPDAELRSRLAQAVSQAPDGVTVRTNQWPDDGTGGTMLHQALALGANRVERLGVVDVVVLDNGDRVQGIFSCGGLWFNIHVEPDPVQQRPDLTWSQTSGRYEAIVDWLQVLEDSLGCTSSSASASASATTTLASTTTDPQSEMDVPPVEVSCSEELTDYPCEGLIDGSVGPGWQASSDAIGDVTLAFTFDRPYEMTAIGFTNLTDSESFLRNARVRGMEVAFDDLAQVYYVELDDDNTETQWFTVRSLGTTTVTIWIRSAYPGVMVGDLPPFGELALGEITFRAVVP